MSEQEKGGGGAFWFGFVLGAFAGAATAWLLMPEEGSPLRSQLRERGIELKSRMELASEEAIKRAEKLRERAMELSAEMRKLADTLEERSRITLEEQRTRLEEAVTEAKEAARKKREELELHKE